MKMKLVLSLLHFFCFTCSAQMKSAITQKFEFSISSIDKSMFFDEIAYRITKSKLIIIHRQPLIKKNEKGEILFTAKLDSLEKINFYNLSYSISTDSLKSQYSNLCIMDGMFLVFSFEWPNQKKSTALFNYYLDKMQPFVDFVNKKVPKKYKIWYNKVELEKDMNKCPPDRILN